MVTEPFSHNYKLASHTPYIVCVNFMHEIFWETFLHNFIYSQSFCHKTAERKLPKKYFFIIRFAGAVQVRGFNRGHLISNARSNNIHISQNLEISQRYLRRSWATSNIETTFCRDSIVFVMKPLHRAVLQMAKKNIQLNMFHTNPSNEVCILSTPVLKLSFPSCQNCLLLLLYWHWILNEIALKIGNSKF